MLNNIIFQQQGMKEKKGEIEYSKSRKNLKTKKHLRSILSMIAKRKKAGIYGQRSKVNLGKRRTRKKYDSVKITIIKTRKEKRCSQQLNFRYNKDNKKRKYFYIST